MKKTQWMKAMALCSVLLVGAVLGLASDAYAQSVPPLETGPTHLYKIVNVNSGKVLDVSFNSKEATIRLVQWEYLGLASQKWYLWGSSTAGYQIINYNSGKALEPAARDNGAKIWQMYFNVDRPPQQLWRIAFDYNTATPPYRITNLLTYRDIDVEFNSTGNGAYIHQWQFVPGVQSQLWRFEPVN
ncbi:RICIN domain-containing protein [Hyalangium minutum]|uniref:Ricin B lectin domain-containing protein n=1 Tax=Hyalangium minutum TaxID=394096 RepID=A0A085WFV0_9BACT|nr:RICIN domain-containing protein [Hyalangium minutum]KFE66563.1 hypothetical protein DB31_1036 [Hyalangium minutum]